MSIFHKKIFPQAYLIWVGKLGFSLLGGLRVEGGGGGEGRFSLPAESLLIPPHLEKFPPQ